MLPQKILLSALIVAVHLQCSASYNFQYSINALDIIMQHREEGHLDIVHGSYSFLQPDGKIRTVDYNVDGDHGFKSAVIFRRPTGRYPVGHLKFPKYYSKPIILKPPVGLITKDLFKTTRKYPNLP